MHRLTIGVVLLAAGAARAQFDAFTWTLVDPDSEANHVAGDEMHIECTPIGFGSCDTRYETTATATGTFTVDVSSDVMAFGGGLGAYTYRNGVKTPICLTCTTTATLDVEAGDTFGFGMNASDFLFASVTYEHLGFTPKPIVQSIGKTLAYVQDPVRIKGAGFGADTTVSVGGVPQAVLTWTPTMLVIEPPAMAPGFHDVRVVNGGAAVSEIEGGLAALPTLAVSAPQIGQPLSIAIQGGVAGNYLLLYGLLPLPAPVPVGGAWHGLLIDPSLSFGVLLAGTLSGSAPTELRFGIPDDPVLAGVPLQLQAWQQQSGAPDGVTASFSNAFSGVLGFAQATSLLALELQQPEHFDEFGATLARLGDLDRDGIAELAVGAPQSDEAAGAGGSVRVHSGADGEVLFAILGTDVGGRLGSALDGIDDTNGDGVADLVVAEGGAGRVTIRSGVDGAVLRTIVGPVTAVAGLGDLDDDGVPEVAIGNGTFNSSHVGIHSGATGALLRVHTAPSQDKLGASLAWADDIDRDGVDDYIVGAPVNGCGPGQSYARIYSGADGSELFTFHASSCQDLGTSVAAAGDVDLDGWPDVVVGGPAGSGASQMLRGLVRVYSGRNGAILHELLGELPIAYPPIGPVVENFGHAVGGAGDVNGDGVPDILVGVPWRGGHPSYAEGVAQVYSGAFGTRLYEFAGTAEGAWLGHSVEALGDVNGDGHADFAAGAPYEHVGSFISGEVVVWSGVP